MPLIHINCAAPCFYTIVDENLLIWNGLKRTNSTSTFWKYLHHGWRKFLISKFWKRLGTNKFNFYFLKVSSPWLKKILSFKALKRLKTNKFNFYILKVSSLQLKKILNLNALKCFRTNKFNFYFLKASNYPHHGWRKFWV